MAYYAALVSLVQLLDDTRHGNVRYPNFDLGKQEITKSLHEKFSLLQKSLQDYLSNGDEAADYLETRIRDASYQAQDIIESQIPDEKTHVIMKILYRLISAMCPKHRRKVYRGLKRVEEEVDSILEELVRIKKSYKIEVFGGSKSSLDYVDVGGSERARSAGNTMVGFDEHLTTIKDKLCGGSTELQTVPIVGMGGIGKTTLARNILDDKLIVHHFDIRVWVTISQNYHTQNVFQAIVDSINSATQEFRELSEEQLALYIHQRLKGWRYLIIMDDIWSTNVLDDVKRISPDDCNGSRILLTTRLSEVAVYDNTVGSYHQMQFLNEEQSWNLLREKVFGQERCPLEFEDLGKSIAHNCRGLPLAIVAVAGVLSKVNRTRYNWKKIASNVGSVVSENDKNFSKILYLSYNYLPHHLKPCFLYIGIFLKDQEISVSRLIKLWIAEGFLKWSKEFKSLEEVGEEYLDDLVKRNLVLITKKRYNGKSKFCNIHDLLKDLCTQRILSESFFHVTSEYECISEGNKYMRRVRFNSKRGGFPHRDKTVSSLNVRSILCLRDYFPLRETLSCAKRLRVLDALQYKLSDFPDAILDLFHLRYLALHINTFYVQNTRFPPLISKLRNLETLILIPSSEHISLPSQIWKMPQLRHLIVGKATLSLLPFYTRMLCEVHILENLQTLSGVLDFRFTGKALEMIPNLNKLKVNYIGLFENGNWEFYCLNNLINLQQLEILKINFFPYSSLYPEHKKFNFPLSPFPESFAFPLSLKKLSLVGCAIPWKDLSVVGCLPNLQGLKLQVNAMVGEVWEPIQGEFLRLKFLRMDYLDLEYWRADDTHFPCLEHLKIRRCMKLKEIPSEIGEIPTLELIEVHESAKAARSAELIQEEQESAGNNTLQVRVFRDYQSR